jgi:hypothetical protein
VRATARLPLKNVVQKTSSYEFIENNKEMDPARFRQQVIVGVVKSPVVAVPAVAGGVALAVSLLLGKPTGFLAFLGVTGLFLAAGTALTRLVWGSGSVAAEVHEDYVKSLGAEHEQYLDQLERRVEGDSDKRTKESLDKLRKLHARLHRDGLLSESVEHVYFSEICDKVEQLYLSCLKTLERASEFLRAAAEMATPEARQEVLQQREQLLSEVSSGVGHLEATVDQLRAKQLQDGSGERELQQVREELDMGLRVAREVEQRMSQFEQALVASPEAMRE